MFYKKGIHINNTKQMYEFLNSHFMYSTMNSWNGLKSVANNVKMYNLDLDGSEDNALSFLYENDGNNVLMDKLNTCIEEFEKEYEGYAIGFNGRSNGYLVLYSKQHNGNILPSLIIDNETYEKFKEDVRWLYGGVKYYKMDLRFYTKLVQDFDKLCDRLRNIVNEYSLIEYQL